MFSIAQNGTTEVMGILVLVVAGVSLSTNWDDYGKIWPYD